MICKILGQTYQAHPWIPTPSLFQHCQNCQLGMNLEYLAHWYWRTESALWRGSLRVLWKNVARVSGPRVELTRPCSFSLSPPEALSFLSARIETLPPISPHHMVNLHHAWALVELAKHLLREAVVSKFTECMMCPLMALLGKCVQD